MKYFATSLMLPFIFHEIMIDDYIEGGKCYQLSDSRNYEQVQEVTQEDSFAESEVFNLSEFGQFGTLRIDRVNLNRIIKNHKDSINLLKRNLTIFNHTLIWT